MQEDAKGQRSEIMRCKHDFVISEEFLRAMLVMMESCWLSKASGFNMYLLSLFPNEVLLLPDN